MSKLFILFSFVALISTAHATESCGKIVDFKTWEKSSLVPDYGVIALEIGEATPNTYGYIIDLGTLLKASLLDDRKAEICFETNEQNQIISLRENLSENATTAHLNK